MEILISKSKEDSVPVGKGYLCRCSSFVSALLPAEPPPTAAKRRLLLSGLHTIVDDSLQTGQQTPWGCHFPASRSLWKQTEKSVQLRTGRVEDGLEAQRQPFSKCQSWRKPSQFKNNMFALSRLNWEDRKSLQISSVHSNTSSAALSVRAWEYGRSMKGTKTTQTWNKWKWSCLNFSLEEVNHRIY